VEDAAKALRKFEFQTSTCVKKGNARRLILECEESWQPDLIVLGSHGRKGLGRLLLGSVAESVARHAKCSVQIVREPGIGSDRRRNSKARR
jgi:nucleotide-binding universal stress UspA family protein